MGAPGGTGDARLGDLKRWLAEDLGFVGCAIEPASADASFRRYFRLTRAADSYIVMDAPPARENLGPFLKVAADLAGIGLSVPRVLARNVAEGFLLLTDLGSTQYLGELTAGRDVDRLYADALAALLRMQAAGAAAGGGLPVYDRALLVKEMELMPEWFLERHLGIEVHDRERAMLERLYAALAQSALAQPARFVHRDYHSRNLMVLTEGNPGILDFQDAVVGPLTYDLVSLLKDCYVAWPDGRVRAWALEFFAALRRSGFHLGAGEAQFLREFDLMGLQRHIKVLGIFCRLHYRDGKPQYLHDLPRVLQYTQAAAAAYPETREWADFIAERVHPRFEIAQARAGAAVGAGQPV
jgi:aminoglycoside/choline kinase family phosphotransferase